MANAATSLVSIQLAPHLEVVRICATDHVAPHEWPNEIWHEDGWGKYGEIMTSHFEVSIFWNAGCYWWLQKHPLRFQTDAYPGHEIEFQTIKLNQQFTMEWLGFLGEQKLLEKWCPICGKMFLGRWDGYIVNLQCAVFWMMKKCGKGMQKKVFALPSCLTLSARYPVRWEKNKRWMMNERYAWP